METAAVRTTEYEISHAGAVEQFLIDAYGTSMRIRGHDDHHLLRHRRADAGPFATETACQSADLEFNVEPLDKLVITRTSTSRLERATDGADRRYDTGELFLMSEPDRPYTARWMPGEIQNCIIDPSMLASVADSAPARRPGPIRFASLDPRTPAAAAHWWATRCYVAGLLASPETAGPLVIASAAQLLAAVTLDTFPNTALTDLAIEDRHDAHPATLRRAVAFIDENAHTAVTIAGIAAAAHVSIRAIQLAFRQHLDTTPMEYLRQVRLSSAHRDLLTADPARHTITSIACRWGFPSASRFGAYYRQAYGVTPGHTLRHRLAAALTPKPAVPGITHTRPGTRRRLPVSRAADSGPDHLRTPSCTRLAAPAGPRVTQMAGHRRWRAGRGAGGPAKGARPERAG